MYPFSIDFKLSKFIIGFLSTIFISNLINKKSEFANVFFDVLMLFTFIPFASVLCFLNYPIWYLLVPFLIVSTALLSGKIFSKMPLFEIKQLNIFPEKLFKLSIFIFFLITISLFLNTGGEISLNFLQTYIDAYDLREDIKYTGFLGYLIGWYYFLIPLIISFLLCKKLYLLSLLFIPAAFLIYSILPVTILPVLVVCSLIIGFLFIYKRGILAKYIPYIFNLSLFLLSFIPHPFVKLFINRSYYIPSINSIFYIDYFSNNPLRFFYGSFLDSGIRYDLNLQGLIIDSFYYYGKGTNHSAGWIPIMFSNIGLFGTIISSIFVVLVLHILQRLKYISNLTSYLISFVYALLLINIPFPQMFLSNGLIFIILISFLLPNKNKKFSQNL